jgi:hypothetical protein
MHRRTLIAGVLAITGTLCATIRRSAAWVLFTPDEINRERAAPHNEPIPFALPPPNAPVIKVEEPDLTKPIKPPVTIRVTFQAQGKGAVIDPESFQATYGWLRIPITDRILEHSTLSASGLVATNVEFPPGSYSVTLQIADNRTPPLVGVSTLEFTVV